MYVNLGFEGMTRLMNALLSILYTLEYLLGPLIAKNGCWGVEGDFKSPTCK